MSQTNKEKNNLQLDTRIILDYQKLLIRIEQSRSSSVVIDMPPGDVTLPKETEQ